MAQIEALNISVDVTQATASLAKLDEQIEQLKERQQELRQETAADAEEQAKIDEEYNAVTQSIKVLTQEKTALNREIQHTIKEAKAEEGSLQSMRDHVANLYREYVNMSAAKRESAEGQAFIRDLVRQQDELKALEAAVGDYRRNVGNYANSMVDAFNSISPALGSLVGDFKKGFGSIGPMFDMIRDGFNALKDKIGNVGKAMSGATGAVGKLKAGFSALAIHPIVAVLSVIVGLFMALQKRISASEKNSNKLSVIMAKFKPILDAITNTLDVLIGLFLSWIDILTTAYTKIASVIASITDFVGITNGAADAVESYNNQVKEYIQLEKDKQALEERSRDNMVEEAKMRSEIARLMEEQKDAEAGGAYAKSIKKLNAAREKELAIYKEKKAIAKENLRILEEEAKQASNDAEANKKLAEAKADVYKADEEYYKKEREYIEKDKTIKDKQLKDEKERQDKKKKQQAEALREAEEHANALLSTREKLNAATVNLMEEGTKKQIAQLKLDYNNKIIANNKLIEEYYQNKWVKEAKMLVEYNKLLSAQLKRDMAKVRVESEKQVYEQIKSFNKLYNDYLTAYYNEGTAEWLKGMKLNIAAQTKQLKEQMYKQYNELTSAIAGQVDDNLITKMLLKMWYGVNSEDELNENLKKVFERQRDIVGNALKRSMMQLGGYANDANVALQKLDGKTFIDNFVESFVGNGSADSHIIQAFIQNMDKAGESIDKLNGIVHDYWATDKAAKEMRDFFRDKFEAMQNDLLNQKMYDKEYADLCKKHLEDEIDYYTKIAELNNTLNYYNTDNFVNVDHINKEISQEQLKYDQLLTMQENYLAQEHDNDKQFAQRKLLLEYEVFQQKQRLLNAKANLTRAELQDTGKLLSSMSDMVAAFDEESKESVILQKSLGLATVLINEGIAISEAVKKNAEHSISPIQFALQMAAEAATIAASIASAARAINSVKYARGGIIDGKGSGTSDSNYVRVSNGEAIINAASVKQFAPLLSQINEANGGRTIATNGTAATVDSNNFIASQMALALSAMPAPVVSVREITSQQNRVNVIESRARY